MSKSFIKNISPHFHKSNLQQQQLTPPQKDKRNEKEDRPKTKSRSRKKETNQKREFFDGFSEEPMES